MMRSKLFNCLLLFLAITHSTFAQSSNKIYIKPGSMGAVLTSANYKRIDTQFIFSMPRLSYVITPIELHYNIRKKIGLISAVTLMNNGIAESYGTIKYRERVLSTNWDINAKWGNLKSNSYWLAGFQLGYNFHFKHQHWTIGQQHHRHILQDASVQKLGNKWPLAVNIGRQQKKFGWKLRYEFSNFYGTEYAGNNLSVMHVFKQANLWSIQGCWSPFGQRKKK